MKVSRPFRVLAFAITLAIIALLYSLRAPGQTAPAAQPGPSPYWQAIAAVETFKALNLLPAWAGIEDDWRFLVSADSARRVVCLQDRGTGQRFTVTGRLERFLAGMQYDPGVFMDLWETNAQPRPRALAVDVELCWPQAGTIGRARTLGEEAFEALVHVRPSRAAPLDWATMRAAYVMGRPQAGLWCGSTRLTEPTEHPDPLVGWYSAPGGGMTRCRLYP
jgi:hypothetical protein